MSKFAKFAADNSSAALRSTEILCRMWLRAEGKYTSGNTIEKGKPGSRNLNGDSKPIEFTQTFWVAKDGDGYNLLHSNKLDAKVGETSVLARLNEGEVTDKNTQEKVPVLRGQAFINGKPSELVVRLNTKEQKAFQVEKATAEGRVSLIQNQPDAYITIASYNVGKIEEVIAKTAPTSVEEMPF